MADMIIERTDNSENAFLMDSAPGAKTLINGKECFYFGGTSYYELHKNEEVIRSAAEALKKYGIDSSSSRNSYGTTRLLLDVEKEAAEFFNCEDSVYLPSGFLTDLAAVQSIVNQNEIEALFIDEDSHYSNDYAARISGKPVYRFAHMDVADLEEKISKNILPGQKMLVLTDGIFPVFGEIAPVDKYSHLIEKYGGFLWVDDAHALGVLGDNGRGTHEHYKISNAGYYFGGTLSKAFGGFGGIIPGNKKFIDDIKANHIHNGSTPPPSPAAAASLTGLKLVKSNPGMRSKLRDNAKRLKTGLTNIGVKVEQSDVPIAAWTMNNKMVMQKLQNKLMEKNIVIQFIQYVGAGEKGALRIVVFSSHTNDQIDYLVDELKKII
ncbi:MAG: hypothetical protein CVV24_11040 [Ignavibacteriae bacterium HGW-Ignavibacteriae-3]|nr:MAG: hypothetical protein CVV24_11040 [Ignavibacteriae bacterium HGW-Ignavibacteriae-3]